MKLFSSNTNTVTYCLFVHASTLWGSSTQSENEQYFHFCGELSRLIVHRCASPIIGQKMLKWKLSPLTSFNLVYVHGVISNYVCGFMTFNTIKRHFSYFFCVLFFSLDLPGTNNQILNIKCQPTFLVDISIQNKKRQGYLILSLNRNNKKYQLVFGF